MFGELSTRIILDEKETEVARMSVKFMEQLATAFGKTGINNTEAMLFCRAAEVLEDVINGESFM